MSPFVIELLAAERRAVSVELSIRRDTVEVWSGKRRLAVIDRAALRDWLSAPDGNLTVDEVIFTDIDGDRVGLVIADIGAWPLADHVRASLRDRI